MDKIKEYLKLLQLAKQEKPLRCPICGSIKIATVLGTDLMICKKCRATFLRKVLEKMQS